jgi:arylsulfatase A-like enzyme
MFWSSGGREGKWAVRSGRWKLIGQKNLVELFDLEADLGETTDLSKQEPQKVAELTRLHDAWLDEMAEPAKGGGKRWSPDVQPRAGRSKQEKAQQREDRKRQRALERNPAESR